MSQVNDMALPAGKTCRDCFNYARCKMLFKCGESNTECDWAPSRFRGRPKAVEGVASA